MKLNLHETLGLVMSKPGDEEMDLQHGIEGWRFGSARKVMKSIHSQVDLFKAYDEDWQVFSMLTFTITSDPHRNPFKRVLRSRHHILVTGFAGAVQIYLHNLERAHGHRR